MFLAKHFQANSVKKGFFSRFSKPCIFLAISLALPAHAELPAPIHSLSVNPTADKTITIGEVFNSEIQVTMAAGYVLETAVLPQPGSAVNDVLEWRDVQWTAQTADGETRYRIGLDYQAFKGVRTAESLTVPPLLLRFRHGDEAVAVEAPAWTVTLTPLIASATPDEAVVLRGDLPPPTLPPSQAGWGVAACLGGLFGLAAYAAWRLEWLPWQRRKPFARAARVLRKLARRSPTPQRYAQAARQFHAALNEVAGYALISPLLPRFLAENPLYAPFSAELAEFFARSDRLFFTDTILEDSPVSILAQLCQQLAAVEESA